MCGIVGLIYADRARSVDRGVVESLCNAIRHRGPDEVGLHVQGRVGLGMRRLSIIDLEGGSQPIFNEDRSKVIVFNGEIYNYRDLRTLLVGRGHRVRTDTDTETIVHLYEDKGADCVEDLRGMFAFAIWDSDEETLLIACDRFGIKPLYYIVKPWGIAFASELKALHAVGLVDRSLDWNALGSFFRLGYVPAPSTPFIGVRKLEAGHILRWHPERGVTTHCYWDIPVAEGAPVDNPPRRVLEWIDDAVQAHLVSDVPVAAFLSGGLDSSAIVSSMAITDAPPHAFTVRYHGAGAERADETPLAASLAQRYGAKLTVVDVEPNVRDLLEPVVFALDEPHGDESAIPTWLISERVASEYKVALVGTGGDELFGGYERHIGLLASAWWTRLPAPLRHAARVGINKLPDARGGSLGVHRLKRFVSAPQGTLPERYFGISDKYPAAAPSLFNSDIDALVDRDAARDWFVNQHEAGGEPDGLRGALYLDYKTYLPGDLLHISDRLAMAHSLEIRVPFVDHELVSRVFPLSDWVKIGPWRKKHLLRRALRSRLPAEHFRAPKRGFVGPTAMWLRNDLRDMMLDELAEDRINRLGYFDPKVVRQMIDDHLSHRHNRESVLWSLLCFSTWHRLYQESGSAPELDRRPVAGDTD